MLKVLSCCVPGIRMLLNSSTSSYLSSHWFIHFLSGFMNAHIELFQSTLPLQSCHKVEVSSRKRDLRIFGPPGSESLRQKATLYSGTRLPRTSHIPHMSKRKEVNTTWMHISSLPSTYILPPKQAIDTYNTRFPIHRKTSSSASLAMVLLFRAALVRVTPLALGSETKLDGLTGDPDVGRV